MNCEDRSLVQVKSKFEHEFRRFSVARSTLTFTQLRNQVLEAHRLPKTDDIVMVYLNPASRDVVPLTDDASLANAIGGVSPLLRLFLHRRSHNRTAEYESESDGLCSECSSDSDHEGRGRGGGGAGDRGQQSGPGGGGAGDRGQQSGPGGGGAGDRRQQSGSGGGGAGDRRQQSGSGGGGAGDRSQQSGPGGGGAGGRTQESGSGGGGAGDRGQQSGSGGGGAGDRSQQSGSGGSGAGDRSQQSRPGGGGAGDRRQQSGPGGGGAGDRGQQSGSGGGGAGDRSQQSGSGGGGAGDRGQQSGPGGGGAGDRGQQSGSGGGGAGDRSQQSGPGGGGAGDRSQQSGSGGGGAGDRSQQSGSGGGGAGDRSQQSGPGGGGAGDSSQQSGSGGGGAAGDSTVCTHAVNSTVGTAQSRKAQHSSDCSLGSGCRARSGSSDGGEVFRVGCAGRETLSELSLGSGASGGPSSVGEQVSSGGSEQSRAQASTGCGTDCHPHTAASCEPGSEPHPSGAGGKDSQNWRGCVCEPETVPSRDEEAREDSISCASEHGHVLPGPRVISGERQGPPQLCQALPVHPLLPTSRPEISCSNTEAECGLEFHPKTASTSDDLITQNRDTVLRVTADMLPPHPLLATSRAASTVTVPPSNKTTPTFRDTTPPAQQTTEDKFPYVVEIYDFDACLKTRDLLTELRNNCRPEEFRLKWVDDTHALGIFASSEKAWLVTRAPYQQFKTRLVREGTVQSRAMAEKLAADMQPSGHCGSAPRPKHTAMVARRMVASALGVRVRVSPEQRQKESQELQQARARQQVLRATPRAIPG